MGLEGYFATKENSKAGIEMKGRGWEKYYDTGTSMAAYA